MEHQTLHPFCHIITRQHQICRCHRPLHSRRNLFLDFSIFKSQRLGPGAIPIQPPHTNLTSSLLKGKTSHKSHKVIVLCHQNLKQLPLPLNFSPKLGLRFKHSTIKFLKRKTSVFSMRRSRAHLSYLLEFPGLFRPWKVGS